MKEWKNRKSGEAVKGEANGKTLCRRTKSYTLKNTSDAVLSDITKNFGKLASGAFDALKYIEIS